jgi:peptidoglycan/xylan/chitin deacetylase (PgdA/CDA1 family)
MDLAKLARRGATYAMRLVPLRAYGRLMPREVIGLCYHVVSDRHLPHVRPLYPYKNIARFEADLVFLKRRLRPVSYGEMLEARSSGRPLPPGSVHLSFDDGYAECFQTVRPLLLKHGIPCTFFVTTEALDNRVMLEFNRVALCMEALARLGHPVAEAALREASAAAGTPFASVAELAAWLRRAIRDPDSGGTAAVDRLCAALGVDAAAYLAENRPYLTRDQVRQMAAEGFTIGGHSRLHWQMGRTRGYDRVEHEIVESCRIAAELSGAEQVPFAFPYDATGVDRAFLADLVARHPRIGPLFGAHGLQPDAPYLVNRMLADAPPRIGRTRSNLAGLITDGYLNELLERRTSSFEPTPAMAALSR